MKPCARILRMLSGEEALTAELERHLFCCEACRKAVRVEQLLGSLGAVGTGARSVSEVPPGFVEGVMKGLDREVVRPERKARAYLGWAAAALIFSLAAGYAFARTEETASALDQAASISAGASSDNPAEPLPF
jgi:hypothetical protein